MSPRATWIDFETRSPVDLKRSGAWRYARHPQTEILCLSFKRDRGRSRIWVPEYFNKTGTQIPDFLALSIAEGDIFEAHNAFFERVIWRFIAQARWGWPELPPERWADTAAIAAAHALPRSLDGVSQALSLTETKDMTGHRIMLKLSKPRKPSKYNKARYHAKPKDFETLYRYCIKDTRTAAEVSRTLSPLSAIQRETWELDQRINWRGVHCDREAVEGALKILSQLKREANERIRELTNGEIETIGQVARIVSFCNELGLSITSIAKDKVKSALDLPHLDPIVREVLELRQTAARSSTEKYKAMLERMDTDNRIRELIQSAARATAPVDRLRGVRYDAAMRRGPLMFFI